MEVTISDEEDQAPNKRKLENSRDGDTVRVKKARTDKEGKSLRESLKAKRVEALGKKAEPPRRTKDALVALLQKRK